MGIDDLDQQLFGWVWRAVKKLSGKTRALRGMGEDEQKAHAVLLSDIAPRLRLLGSALGGGDIEVHEAESAAGVRGDRVLLPRVIALGTEMETSVQAYLFTLVYQLAVREIGLRLPEGASPPVATWLAMAPVLARIEADLPGANRLLDTLRGPLLSERAAPVTRLGGEQALELSLRALLGEAPDDVESPEPLPDVQAWCSSFAAASESLVTAVPDSLADLFNQHVADLEPRLEALGDVSAVTPFLPFGWLRPHVSSARPRHASAPAPASALPTGTEHEGKAKEEVRRVEMDDRPQADNPLVHSFEKVHTAEEYGGGQKSLDGADELNDHLDALDELDIREVIRTRERTHSIMRADALLEGAAPELHDGTPDRPPDHRYDEWDGRTRSYQRDHCSLYLERARPVKSAAAAEWIATTLTARRRELIRLERELQRIALERRPVRRRRDGTEVDLDAAVDARATLAAGCTPSDRLYIEHRPSQPTLSVLLLIDMSLSSDAYVAGQRVLDVSREAVFVLGQALGESAELAVAGFHSNTRRDCRFVTVKRFGESWHTSRGRLVGLEPRGYTRIGPALRHGTHALRKARTRRRVIVVVTDGQPTDYDRYEGRHGMADVQQAVREAKRDGVDCFALAVAHDRRSQLGQMFGHDRYSLMTRADQLPDAMGRLLTELLRI